MYSLRKVPDRVRHAEARVRVLPYSADPRSVAVTLASADVFVHAGTRETFGLAALEALACGTPVVLPASAGFMDLIDGGAALGVGNASAERSCGGRTSLRDQPGRYCVNMRSGRPARSTSGGPLRGCSSAMRR